MHGQFRRRNQPVKMARLKPDRPCCTSQQLYVVERIPSRLSRESRNGQEEERCNLRKFLRAERRREPPRLTPSWTCRCGLGFGHVPDRIRRLPPPLGEFLDLTICCESGGCNRTRLLPNKNHGLIVLVAA